MLPPPRFKAGVSRTGSVAQWLERSLCNLCTESALLCCSWWQTLPDMRQVRGSTPLGSNLLFGAGGGRAAGGAGGGGGARGAREKKDPQRFFFFFSFQTPRTTSATAAVHPPPLPHPVTTSMWPNPGRTWHATPRTPARARASPKAVDWEGGTVPSSPPASSTHRTRPSLAGR